MQLGCQHQSKSNETSTKVDSDKTTSTKQRNDKAKYHTTLDTMSIATELGDTLRFTNERFNKLVDGHEELYSDLVYNPDILYYDHAENIDLGSEADQDAYYVLYAYFLKQKNGVDKYNTQRKTLINIYSHINSLFDHFQYGGTFFGHQRLRLVAYAEYSIYLMPKKVEDSEKTYPITKQKELYIKSLRQLILDESKIDYETRGKEKIERTRTLNKIVDKLDSAITDIFYLRQAQTFQYDNYQYY